MSSTSSEILRADKIWLDGKVMPWEQGQVHIMTHALHYGLGVFEGIRAYKTESGKLAIFRLKDHLRRFYDSAHICLLKMPFNEQVMAEACLDLLRQQKERFADGDHRLGLGRLSRRKGSSRGDSRKGQLIHSDARQREHGPGKNYRPVREF